MSRSSEYTYDPSTGIWTKSTSDSSASNTQDSTESGSKTEGDNLTSSTPDSSSSTGQVEKTYNEIQINTLEGNLAFIVTKETIQLKAGDTVKLNGLGKHLSGSYYVKELTRSIGSNGYTHSATVIRTDFGNSLKVKSTNATTVEKTPVSSPQTSSNAQKTYTVKAGDCLWNIAKQYYGNGALYTKIYEANKDKIKSNYIIYVGQVLIIP